jgi:chromosome segregation ATPase
LQTQVTELQREKLFYEQRATEHDACTRQKRTELTNLELEMESVYKTLQEREMKKSEEAKRLADTEDKLAKVSSQLVDLRQKFDAERNDVDKLRLQCSHMDSAMRSKDGDLLKIKADLQSCTNEMLSVEARVGARKTHLAELTTELNTYEDELAKGKSRLDLCKQIQANLNRLLKEYDNVRTPNEEMKSLEMANFKLMEQLTTTMLSNSGSNGQKVDLFENKAVDPFQVFDPFNVSSDPFNNKGAPPINGGGADVDPFGTAFDPFSIQKSVALNFESEDPFGVCVFIFIYLAPVF